MRVAALAAVASLLAALPLAACGGQEESGIAGGLGGARTGEGGQIAFAIASRPGEIDPLMASDRQSLLVSRQIHEPLVEEVTGPFGDMRRVPGLADAYRPSGDRTIWRFELRPRVSFQDGEPFNASAVLANAERWQRLAPGRALLPDLVAVDAPRPGLVHFILDRPDPNFPRRLSAPELGIVSPKALPDAGDPSGPLRRETNTGTGPFEIRELEPARVLVVRNVDWWGSRFELGPALDQIEFPVIGDAADRAQALAAGDVQAADDLNRDGLAQLDRHPLVTHERPAGGPPIGLERSVRGVRFDAGLPLLSGAWLTTSGAARR